MTARTPEQKRILNIQQKRRMREKAQGIEHSMPAGPIRDHIRELQRMGLTRTSIAVAADVSFHTVKRILLTAKRVHGHTGRAILGVTFRSALDRATPSTRVPATGTRRRLHALQAMGWRLRDINALTGHEIGALVRDHYTVVRASIAAAVADVYDDLWDKPGPSDVTRQRALVRGFAPPMAWDDDRIDDPKARPVGVEWGRAA